MNKLIHMAPKQKFNWDLALDGSGKNPTMLREQFEQCLKAAAEKRQPFFINVNITDPHRPFAGSNQRDAEDQAERRRTKNQANASPVKMFSESEVIVPPFLEDIPGVRKEVAQYFSSVRRLDQSFAGLLAALKASGQESNTLMVFLSDHGMSFPFAKATIYRNGTWSPLLLRWPGMGQPAVNKADMVVSIDILPTVLDLLEIAKPAGLDGRSFLPILRGEKQEGRDHVFTYVNTVSSGKAFPGRCIRTKTRAYIWNSWPDGKTRFRVEAMSGLSFNAMAEAAARDPKIKARVEQYLFRTPEEFYDIEKDPDERRNLIDDHDSQPRIEQMKQLLLAEMQRSNDPLLAQFQKLGSTGAGGAQDGSPGCRCLGADAATGASTAVIVDDVPLAHTAQMLPVNQKGELIGKGDAAKQADQVLANLALALSAANSELAKTIKLNVYLGRTEALPRVQQALARQFTGPIKPAVSFVVGDLAEPGALVAMDAVATAATQAGEREVRWFTAAGVYDLGGPQAAAVLPAGAKVYVSGMADTNSLAEATRKTLEKLVAALGSLGSQKADIVQLKAFLQPMSQVDMVRKEITSFFQGKAPPVAFVDWISPSPNPPIEIELVAAAKGDFSREAECVSFLTPPSTTASKVFSRVARVNHGKLIYVSGLYGMKAQDAAGQVREIFHSLGEVLQKSGSDFEHLAKTTYYVSDNEASNKLNNIRPEFYKPERPPAASKAKVKGVGMAGKSVTMDMIAVADR
jgi:N-sulfoglucosamine sulfohydrolase